MFLSLCVLFLATLSIPEVACFPVVKFDFSSDNVVDLTYSFDSKTVYWPQLDEHGYSFNLTTLSNGFNKEYGVYFRSNAYKAGEHGGTHIDSPSHFSENGSDAAQITLQELIAPAYILNVSEKATNNNDYVVTVEDVADFEKEHGLIPEGAFVLMFSDWGKRWPDKNLVFNSDNTYNLSSLHYPGFDANVTDYLIRERKIKGLGVDSPSTDSSGARPRAGTHVVLARHNLVGIEFIANMDQLPAVGAQIITLPMKITNGSGAPTRIIAVLPNRKD